MSANAQDLALHAASVPVLQRYLGQLQQMLQLGRREGGLALLESRLAPDMLPLRVQAVIAGNFALRASFLLTGQAVPDLGPDPRDWAGLILRLDQVERALASLSPAQFAGAHARWIHDQAGQAALRLEAGEFLHHYALPNFFFHVCSAYAILRNQGLSLGKAHFDGYHRYQPG